MSSLSKRFPEGKHRKYFVFYKNTTIFLTAVSVMASFQHWYLLGRQQTSTSTVNKNVSLRQLLVTVVILLCFFHF